MNEQLEEETTNRIGLPYNMLRDIGEASQTRCFFISSYEALKNCIFALKF